ncbi:MAG: GNAT family N-acetyltransferase [Clostridia bacterium]
MFKVRYALDKDAGKIEELLYDIANLHHIGRPDVFKSAVRKYSKEELIENMKDKNQPIFVLTDEQDTVLAYTICQIKNTKNHEVLQDRTVLFIDDFCVDKEARGEGLGQFFFKEIKEICKNEYNISNIELNVWEFNEKAINFYEKCGFNILKRVMEIQI